MNRRKFLRNSGLVSLAVALGKGFAWQRKPAMEQCGQACKDVVSIVLHGFMYYRFTPDSDPQNLEIIAPSVQDHAYLWGQVGRGRDGSRLQCITSTATFPPDGLAPGKLLSFPQEVPSFSLDANSLGEITEEGARFTMKLPLPDQILALNPHRTPVFGGKVGQGMKPSSRVAGAICLQYRLSGPPPSWIQDGRVNFYSQRPFAGGMGCLDDSDGAHFNRILKDSARHFSNAANFELTAKCTGKCDRNVPSPPNECNLCVDDLYDLCDLERVPSCSSAGKRIAASAKRTRKHDPGTTGGPLCVGFVVTRKP